MQANDLWCADFKGEFLLSGRSPRRYCYPLTISDSVSRYLFSCEALESTKLKGAFPAYRTHIGVLRTHKPEGRILETLQTLF